MEKTTLKVTTTTKVHKTLHYKIRQNDTLAIIAKKFHVSVKDLKKANHLKNEKHLQIGHSLIIP